MELPNIPDDEVNPLSPDFKWILKVLGAMVAFIAVSYLVSIAISSIVVRNLSIEDEKKYFSSSSEDMKKGGKPLDSAAIAYPLELPHGISVTVVDRPEANAYATLWADIIVTKELLRTLENEETLLFIIGHEVEHILRRDPINRISRDVPMRISLAFLGVDSGIDTGMLANLTSNFFSRQQEIVADNGGFEMLRKRGANPECVKGFFKKDDPKLEKYLSVVSTHPARIQRLEGIDRYVRENPTKNAPCRPLSDSLKNF